MTMEVYNMNRNRTQEEIDFEEMSFEIEVIELNKDMHDNCDLNTCQQCAVNYSLNDIKNISLELEHSMKHKITLVHYRTG